MEITGNANNISVIKMFITVFSFLNHSNNLDTI